MSLQRCLYYTELVPDLPSWNCEPTHVGIMLGCILMPGVLSWQRVGGDHISTLGVPRLSGIKCVAASPPLGTAHKRSVENGRFTELR